MKDDMSYINLFWYRAYDTDNMADGTRDINVLWYRAHGTDNMVDGTRGHLPACAVLCCSMC